MGRLPVNLPAILRDAGLKVVELDGWQTRGRPASTGGFDPVGVLCHHTATSVKSSNADVERLLVVGRSDLPGPLCHLGLRRDGTVVVVAAGRANHAGAAKASGTVAAGDGNSLYIGIEAYNDGRGEPWPKAQMDAYATLCAVLSAKVTGSSVATVRGHKETSLKGKIDPTFDMDAFRARVAPKITGLRKPVLPESAPKKGGPKQVRLVAANLDFTTGERADGKHLAHLFDQPAPAVIVGVQEAKNIRLAEVAPPGSTAYQKTLTAARRGSGFVARGIKISNFRLFLGGLSKVTEPRWVARGRVHLSGGPLVPFSSHVAPKRAGKAAQDRHLRSLKRRTDKCARNGVAWAVMGDFNRDIEDVARYLNGKVAAAAKGDRIVGVIVSHRVTVLARGVDRYGRQNGLTDHLAPWADVTIR